MNLVNTSRRLLLTILMMAGASTFVPVFAAEPAARVDSNFWKSGKVAEGSTAQAGEVSATAPKEKLSQLDREFWIIARESRNVAEPEAYLQAFPNGAFAKLARLRIEQLRKDAPVTGTAIPPATTAPTPGSNDDGMSPVVKNLIAEIKQLRGMIEVMQRSGASAGNAPALARRLTGRALVIGNGEYAHLGKLLNPRNDAEAIAGKLKSFGLEVNLLLDADRDAMARALAELGRVAVGSDVSILYFAGHAVQLDGENYLLPVDSRFENATTGYIKLIGVPMAAAIENLPTKTRLIFLDACRDNPLSRSIVSTRTTLPKGLAPAESISGTLIAFATRDGSTAEDGTGRHSPYTAAMLQFLDNTEDISVVLRRVRQSVMSATRDRQQPWEYGSLIGEQLVLATMFR